MEISSFSLALAIAGVVLAIAVSIVVGTLTARLFFHASRGHDELAETHEVHT